jgi:transcriptional regulator with XRE-family HTH domain
VNELGKFLEELRGKMSLRAAAEKSGLSHTYIRDLENGINRSTKAPIKPTPETLKRLADAYNYPYEDLMIKAGYINKYDKLILNVVEDVDVQEMEDSRNLSIIFSRDKLDLASHPKQNKLLTLDQDVKDEVIRQIMQLAIESDTNFHNVKLFDLSNDEFILNIPMYYKGMELTHDEKVEFLAIVRGIFDARLALKGKK